MNKIFRLILLTHLSNIDCLNIGRTTFGNFHDSVYIRKKYYWRDNLSILPISVDDAQLISFGWRSVCIAGNISNEFNKFDSTLNPNSNIIFKRVEEEDKSIVNALVSTKIDNIHNTIYVKNILKNPSILGLKINDIVEDLTQLTITEDYKNFKIISKKNE
jgi:hypothetical protein